MRRLGTIRAIPFVVLLLTACNTTKFVPRNDYLLDRVSIDLTDTKQVSSSDLRTYLKQQPNAEVLGFWKLQLHIYNTAALDTTKKIDRWWAGIARRLGEPPVVYDSLLTEQSAVQLTRALQNKGFFYAQVEPELTVKQRKAHVTYHIRCGAPYLLRRHSSRLPESSEMQRIADDERRTLLHEGDLFDANTLDDERKRVASSMRRQGYYYLQKDLLRFEADTTGLNRQVDVVMSLNQSVADMPDSTRARLFTRYTIRRVYFHTDYNPAYAPDSLRLQQKEANGYVYTWFGKPLMRPSALSKNCRIRPGELFDERKVEQTYEMLNQLGIVKYSDISFQPVGKDSLDCHVVMSRSKLHTVSAELEGTYSNGDWGIAAGAGYINRNLFRGAEELQLSVHGSYEWRQNGGRAIEVKTTASLSFANRLKVIAAYNYQTRPDEFTRTIANASLGYSLPRLSRGWSHAFNFVDISYVYLPWIGDEFRSRFLTNQNPLKYSYEDHFIEAINYSCRYSGYNRLQPTRSYLTFHGFAETAGNVLYGVSKAARQNMDDGAYKIGGVPFSQYVKADISLTYNQIVSSKHHIAYHMGMGAAVPYGNSQSIPYEKRYFAGGSNHVRGWTARTLGPGAYHGDGSRIDYDNQAGDLHLDLSIEYRWRVWNFIELAAFTDAGNIWTIRDYDSQPHGAFRWNEFYRQIAWSYGAGIRLDLRFLIFRVDFGVKLYDPSRLYYDQKQWRTAPNGLNWHDDVAVHFAIGYPF